MTYRCKDAAENYKKQLDKKMPSKLGLFGIFCVSVALILILASKNCHASDYIPQEVTSEVYTTEQVTTTNESYQYTNHRNFNSTYCQYKDNRDYCNRNVVPRSYKLQPVAVYTGKTVTVQKHYDVYQPKVVYEKVNSYTTTQTCKYCE